MSCLNLCVCVHFKETSTFQTEYIFLQTNTYQLVVITDLVSQSYVIFIYECDQIEWSGIDPIYARVGISNGPGASYIHPSSGNASVLDIDCANSPVSNFVNVLLDLNTFAPVEQPVSPSSTSTPGLTFSLISSSVTAITPSSTLPSPLATSAFTTQSKLVKTILYSLCNNFSVVKFCHSRISAAFKHLLIKALLLHFQGKYTRTAKLMCLRLAIRLSMLNENDTLDSQTLWKSGSNRAALRGGGNPVTPLWIMISIQ